MSNTHRRKGNRVVASEPTKIVVFVYGQRIDGFILDESEKGLGILLPANSGLTPQQSIRVLIGRERQVAKVIRVEPIDQGDRVGIKVSA